MVADADDGVGSAGTGVDGPPGVDAIAAAATGSGDGDGATGSATLGDGLAAGDGIGRGAGRGVGFGVGRAVAFAIGFGAALAVVEVVATGWMETHLPSQAMRTPA
jgi:hypothetical protein